MPDADVVIEAIFESLEAKRELYARLEPRMKPGALLATNTSSLMLEPLAAKLARPARLVGLHFFNPVAQMPLIEIVQSSGTDAHRRCRGDRVRAYASTSSRSPCRSAPGFIVNRVLTPYLHEAMFAAQEGVALAAIDRTAVEFGMPMGPIELADVVGPRCCKRTWARSSRAELGRPAAAISRACSELVAAKKLGRKSGEGFYDWQDGKPLKAAAAAPLPRPISSTG